MESIKSRIDRKDEPVPIMIARGAMMMPQKIAHFFILILMLLCPAFLTIYNHADVKVKGLRSPKQIDIQGMSRLKVKNVHTRTAPVKATRSWRAKRPDTHAGKVKTMHTRAFRTPRVIPKKRALAS
jgi:hypothetical protein